MVVLVVVEQNAVTLDITEVTTIGLVSNTNINLLSSLNDVTLTALATNQFLQYDGDVWVNVTLSLGGDSWGDPVDANIIPDADGTRNLGSTGTRFGQTFTDSLDVTDDVVIGGITNIKELRIDALPDADHTATGATTNTINAGVATAIGELLYLASDGEWALADADAEATASGMLAISMEVGSDGNPLLVALPGSFMRDDTFAFTVGATLFAGTTAGAIVETAPSATGDIVRVIGYAVTAKVVYFNPGGSWVEVA